MDIECANTIVAQNIIDVLRNAGLDEVHDYTRTVPTFTDARVRISLSEGAALQLPVHTIYSFQNHWGAVIRGHVSNGQS